jgi:hypothetical protein
MPAKVKYFFSRFVSVNPHVHALVAYDYELGGIGKQQG